MIARFAARLLLFLMGGNLVLSLYAAEPAAQPVAQPPDSARSNSLPASTNTFHPLKPGPMDGRIASVTAKLLEEIHYLHPAFNSDVSSKFLDRYLETFDPQRVHFLQSDLAEFAHFRTNLDRLTLANDTTPACLIFNRYVQRLQQHVAYVDELLKHEKFTFDTDERIVINRKDLPYPKDLNEAKQLWRDRLRFEYLQEKLGKLEANKKAATKTESPKAEQEAAAAGKGDKSEGAAANKPKKSESEEIVETLSHRYHRNLHLFIDWDTDDVLQFYLTALAHVYDPHSDYFNHSTLDSFAIQMNLSLFGIGAELTTEDGYCTINRLLPGGPALKSKKIKERDRILAVAQSNQPPVDVVDMSLSKAVQLIRGPKGTEVRLMMSPADEPGTRREVTLIRDEISLPDSAAKARLIELPNGHGETQRLGVISLPSFYAPFDVSNSRSKGEQHSTTTDVARLLTKLKQENVKGVILDLRGNGGGSLEEAIRLTGLFIKEGPVVQVKGFDGSIQPDGAPPTPISYDGPLIVLTSRFSASASEIVAGALQDYGRALIVGDSSTHGKGTVQSVQPLREPLLRLGVPRAFLTNDPGALKVTIKKFYRPSGVSTQLKGVVPDVVLPSILNESKDIGESALEDPLPCDKIPGAKFEHFNLVDPYVAELRKRSDQRLTSDKEYNYIREDIELFKKRQADKTVTLNEKEQIKEKDEAEARSKARDKERASRPESPEVVYELSLKQALLPGLPPPLSRTNVAAVKAPGHPGAEISGVSTNGALASTRANSREANPENTEEEKPAPPDAEMEESEHILVDYLSLLPRSNVATAVQ